MAKRKKQILIFVLLFVILLAGGLAIFYLKYKAVFMDAANQRTKTVSVFIPTGSDYEQLCDSLFHKNLIADTTLFHKVAKYKNLQDNIHAGHFRLAPDVTINQIINTISGNRQTPVNVTFHHIRKIEKLAGKVSNQLELDSAILMTLLHDQDMLDSLGINKEQILGFFIPNTYEFYWNTSAIEFLTRMKQKHDRFWNEKRKRKAASIGLTPEEVSTLASIVQEETNQASEMSRIAGVYINRLNIGMPLQADPTLKYVINDWSIRRVLDRHKQISSPYNTYQNIGLPPGPISMPEPHVIDSVLNYEEHDYLFFFFFIDRPGYHEFSRSLREHNNKANRYRHNLNQRGIYR